MSLVVTIVLACVLAVVGYGVGVPIVNYINEKKTQTGSDSSTPDDSSPSGGESGNSTNTPPESSAPASSETQNPEPEPAENRMYVLPMTATASTEALNSALAVAKEAGYTSAAVTLKDDTGALLYKSDIPRIKDIAEINAGTLSAQQICDIIKKAGLSPAARISTLKDRNAPYFFGTFAFPNGAMWLDNTVAAGGKPWLSPFEEASAAYIGELAEELSAAGFKDIICVDTRYPSYYPVDYDYLSHLPLKDTQKRCEALWNVIDKAKAGAAKNGAKLWIEMSGENLLKDNKSSSDSELAYDKERLKNASVIVRYSAVADVSEVYSDAKAFAESIKTAANGAEVVVMVNSSLKGSALADAERAFAQAGLKLFAED